MSSNISRGKRTVNQKTFPTTTMEQTWYPACLADNFFRLSAGKQLIRITGPGFSLAGQKHIYFLHRLSWRINLFQKSREVAGSFIKQSVREPVIARLSGCGWPLAFRTGWASMLQCCPLSDKLIAFMLPEALPLATAFLPPLVATWRRVHNKFLRLVGKA